jgi:hypothetical protein
MDERLKRAKILLQAMLDMMHKQEQTRYVQNIFELTAVWDGAECDGVCWQEEARDLLKEIG